MAENPKNGTLIPFGFLISVGIIVAAWIVSESFEDIKRSGQTITVKGYAEKDIVSDLASWSCVYSVKSVDLTESYRELEEDGKLVFDYLASQGFDSSKIKIKPIQTIKNNRTLPNGRMTDEVMSYTLQKRLTIESENVEKIRDISQNSTVLIKEGVEFISNSPQYFFTKLNDLKIEMLEEATKDAKERAETLAQSSGSEVGSLTSARQGVFQITSLNSNEVSNYGVYDTYSLNKTIKAVVTVKFSIE